MLRSDNQTHQKVTRILHYHQVNAELISDISSFFAHMFFSLAEGLAVSGVIWCRESGNLSWYRSSFMYFTVTRLPEYHCPCRAEKALAASSLDMALMYTQPSLLSVSTATWTMTALLLDEQRCRISSFTCHIQAVWLLRPGGYLASMVCRLNMWRTLRQDVGATDGAATLLFKLLKEIKL